MCAGYCSESAEREQIEVVSFNWPPAGRCGKNVSVSKVLIVDDHVDQCRALRLLLLHMGHEAWCVESAVAALAFLKEKKPDVMILDVMMPEMDGMELLGILRRTPETARMPVAMFSAIADPIYQQYVLNKGANDYWVKGNLDYGSLESRLKGLLQIA
jgi:CheY-like chemotaxis protein